MTTFKASRFASAARPFPRAAAQHGVILAVTMIVLVIMLISSIALVRSYSGSVAVAGNLAIRRDLVNQGEKAIALILADIASANPATGLTQGKRLQNNTTFNYSACQLAVDVHGVPTILTDTDTNFQGTADLATEPWTDTACFNQIGLTANDITDTSNGTGIVVRYVVDRLCNQTADPSITGCSNVPYVNAYSQYFTNNTPFVNPPVLPIYRISVRATDPRGATTYMQTTFAN